MQAVNVIAVNVIAAYIYTHEMRGVGICVLQLTNIVAKMAWLTKNVYRYIVAPPYHLFLNFASHVTQSGSDPDNFKAGLTRMSQAKHDLNDPGGPTQF